MLAELTFALIDALNGQGLRRHQAVPGFRLSFYPVAVLDGWLVTTNLTVESASIDCLMRLARSNLNPFATPDGEVIFPPAARR